MNPESNGGQMPYQPVSPSPRPTVPAPGQPAVTVSPTTDQVVSVKHDPYEFIRNADHTAPKKVLGGTLVSRILLILAGLVFLAIVAAIVMSLLAPKDGAKTMATNLAQQQEEIIRIADQGTQLGAMQDIRNTAITISTSVANDQVGTKRYLSVNHIKIDPKLLTAKHDPKTDQLLNDAKASSTFDSVWQQTMSQQLTTYQGDVQRLYSQTNNKTFKAVLKKAFDSNKLLLELLARP
ncbi:MAG: hypothetical protein WAV45_14695 [Propionibacteriaceae bacterium]